MGRGQGVFLEFAQRAGRTTRGVDVRAPVAELARSRGLEAKSSKCDSRTSPLTRGFAFLASEEMRGLCYEPLLELGQGLVSPLARSAGAAHHLTMELHQAPRGLPRG